MQDAEPLVRIAAESGVTTLTLNAVARRNALSIPMRDELASALDAAVHDQECRAIVLTGQGEHFCSGGDISGMDSANAVNARSRFESAHRVITMMIEGGKPVIAAVEGYAVGAGLSLAIAADIVVASREAKFSCSFNRIGLVPDLGLAFTLPMRVGMGRARHIMLTGDMFDAQTAERWGVVEALAEPGQALAEATALARRLAGTTAPLSNLYTKRLLSRMPGSLADVLRAEADSQGTLYTSRDHAEGREAFLGKRKPRFEGR
jgi:enoyl-CoA hydratase/carnithine racemase